MHERDLNQLVKDVSNLSRRIQLTHKYADLTDEEKSSFCLLLILRAGLECDLLNTTYLQSRWRRYVLSLSEINIQTYFEDWKTTEREYMNFLKAGKVVPRDFKRHVYPKVTYKGICGLFPYDEVTVQTARQWLVFDGRYQIPSVDRTQTLQAEYIADEKGFSQYEYDVAEERLVINDWFWEWKYTGIVPKHGPGSTTRTYRSDPKILKWYHMDFDADIISVAKENGWDLLSILPHSKRKRLLRSHSVGHFQQNHDWRYCELKFVPKSATTNRVISAEPPALQYFQQGVSRALNDYLTTVPTYRVNLHDQHRSRELALRGSIAAEYATIDCSKASDSVTVQLLRELFRDQPDILRILLATRSEYAKLPDGTKIELSKFAPMGSALCFPVECIVFASICEAVIRRKKEHSAHGDYVVYGDDIVVKTEYAKDVIAELQRCHFLVNTDKSFFETNCFFREACGIEAYLGQDVTPVRISRMMKVLPCTNGEGKLHRTSHDDPRSFVSWVALANNLYANGLRCTRAILHHFMMKDHLTPHVFRVDYDVWREEQAHPGRWLLPSPYIITDVDRATNFRTKTRFNRDLQRLEYRVPVLVGLPTRVLGVDDSMDLFQWFIDKEAVKTQPVSDDPIDSSGKRIPNVILRWKWVAT